MTSETKHVRASARAVRVARALAGAGTLTAVMAGALAGCAGANATSGERGGGAVLASNGGGAGRCPQTPPTGGASCSPQEMNAGHCQYGGDDGGIPSTCICNQTGTSELAWACVTAVSGPLAPPELGA